MAGDSNAIIHGPLATEDQEDIAEEETKFVQESVTVFVDDRQFQGSGTLTVTTQKVVWKSHSEEEKYLIFPWRSVLMHAVSRDTAHFPHPCMYCQVDSNILPLAEDQIACDDGEDDIESSTRDVRFVLQDSSFLGVLFSVFSECQALHPEQQAEGEGDFIFNEDEVLQGASENGLRMPLPGDVDMLTRTDDDDRFADADEDED